MEADPKRGMGAAVIPALLQMSMWAVACCGAVCWGAVVAQPRGCHMEPTGPVVGLQDSFCETLTKSFKEVTVAPILAGACIRTLVWKDSSPKPLWSSVKCDGVALQYQHSEAQAKGLSDSRQTLVFPPYMDGCKPGFPSSFLIGSGSVPPAHLPSCMSSYTILSSSIACGFV